MKESNMDYDVKATVKNLRQSRTPFASGYRPAFKITPDYLTTGEITLIDKSELGYATACKAFIRFLTPEVYPHCLWKGRKIYFMEGDNITGEAVIDDIYNQLLKAER